MIFLKSALAITLVFLLSFGMIGGIVMAPYKIPQRIAKTEQKKDKLVDLDVPKGYRLSDYYTNHLFLEALGDNVKTNKLYN